MTSAELPQWETQRSVVVLIEHLGDIVACEPVVRYLKQRCPERPVAWIIKKEYAEALIAHPLLDDLVFTENLVEATRLTSSLTARHTVVNLHFNNRICMVTGEYVQNDNDPRITSENYYNSGSLLESFSQCAGLPKLSDAPEFHLLPSAEPLQLPEHYAVFHCLSNEEERDWNKDAWKKLAWFLFSQGVHVVEVGLQPVVSSYNPLYHDMTHIRSIQTIGYVISKTRFFFGVDSAFAHIANALRINGLIIMGQYRAFTDHVPYTGYYATGHIVRKKFEPANSVSVDDVIALYRELAKILE
jgi:ADP-heptose:LPS heptosyltransferase